MVYNRLGKFSQAVESESAAAEPGGEISGELRLLLCLDEVGQCSDRPAEFTDGFCPFSEVIKSAAAADLGTRELAAELAPSCLFDQPSPDGKGLVRVLCGPVMLAQLVEEGRAAPKIRTEILREILAILDGGKVGSDVDGPVEIADSRGVLPQANKRNAPVAEAGSEIPRYI
jgi:hypothetical protein